MQEIIQGIRVIKYYAWEASFLKSLFALRTDELQRVKKSQYMRSVTSGITVIVPIFSTILTFLVYHWRGYALTPEIVFPVLTYFNMLRLPLVLLPMVITMCVDAKVSLGRIQGFLLADELSFEAEVDAGSAFGVQTEDAVFEWWSGPKAHSLVDMGSTADLLDNASAVSLGGARKGVLGPITLSIPRGSLVAVVGPVGSGKSSLLNALVGEMDHVRGRVTFGGGVGYAPQQAWIQNKNVQENILFGRALDPERYRMVVEVCALRKDFEMLPDGDLTEIGEKGVNLSGGQKQRISLARILYSNTDIVLLDDPLSAVDAHVGRHLFEQCLCGALADKTRVLVTHQLHLLPQVDYIIVMEQMGVAEQGTYDQLMAAGGPFAELMRRHGGVDGAAGSRPGTPRPQLAAAAKPSTATPEPGDVAKERTRLTTTEERVTGAVAWKVYADYVRWAGGLAFLAAAVLLLMLYNGSRIGNDLWLTYWTERPPRFGLSTTVYAGVYVAWGLAQAVFGYLVGILFALGGIRASGTLHELAAAAVLASPVAFFDQNPLGRIINRFSKDLDTIDNQLPETLRSFIAMLGMAVSSFVLISLVSWAFVPALVVLLLMYYWVQGYYRASSRELKRLDSLARSPFYAQFSETLTGLATIRAFREQQRFVETNARLADVQNRPFFLQQSIQRWLGVRLETIANLLALSASASCYYFRATVPPSAAGLAITYALSITGVLNWLVRMISETETNIIASERLGHYVALAPEEPAAGRAAVADWPAKGAIEFRDVTMTYRPGLAPVLQAISVAIRPGERIGIVGRTGAGKSSVMVALFRIVEPTGGAILIDGIDIRTLPLAQLRRSLSIIPQDPVVFAGTVRSNLDPFGEYADADVWMALDQAHLAAAVRSMDSGLGSAILEGGENLSLGQRQLLCLARAILRRNKILVLDEATANIDLATDALIQDAIRRDFGGCTILTIAHRLNTVIDYDRILVLDHGRVVEFDRPAVLLRNPDSLLAGLVRETGVSNEALLKSLALP